MTTTIVFIFCFGVFNIHASTSQVGIGTSNPLSTLDIRGTNHLGAVTANDGILIPRVNNLTTNGTNDGQMVYLTINTSSFIKGFHYWDATAVRWLPVNTNFEPWNLAGTTNPATSNTDNIYTRGLVGIGTDNPLGALHITTENSRDVLFFSFIDSASDDLDIDLFRSQGTLAAPSLLQDNTRLGGLRGQSITNTSAYNFGPSAEVYFQADGASNATSSAGKINFATTPAGSLSTIDRMTIRENGNIGIGTTAPDASSILHLNATDKGVLIPRIALSDVNTQAPVTNPANGLLIFNTVSAGTFPSNVTIGFYYWDANSNRWRSITDTPVNRTSKFTNNTTSLDFSSNAGSGSGVTVDIFGSQSWNEDTSIFTRINSTDLQILEPGYYEITTNLYLRTDDIERYLKFRLRLNGTDVGDTIAVIGPEDSGSDRTFSTNFTQTIFIDRNDVLRLPSYRDGSDATITFASTQSSSITIKKLR